MAYGKQALCSAQQGQATCPQACCSFVANFIAKKKARVVVICTGCRPVCCVGQVTALLMSQSERVPGVCQYVCAATLV